MYKCVFPKGAVLVTCFISNWPVISHWSLSRFIWFSCSWRACNQCWAMPLKNIEHVSKGSHVFELNLQACHLAMYDSSCRRIAIHFWWLYLLMEIQVAHLCMWYMWPGDEVGCCENTELVWPPSAVPPDCRTSIPCSAACLASWNKPFLQPTHWPAHLVQPLWNLQGLFPFLYAFELVDDLNTKKVIICTGLFHWLCLCSSCLQ